MQTQEPRRAIGAAEALRHLPGGAALDKAKPHCRAVALTEGLKRAAERPGRHAVVLVETRTFLRAGSQSVSWKVAELVTDELLGGRESA